MEYPFYIGVDIDNTINDYCIKLLQYYNQKYCDNIPYECIKTYDIQSYLRPECKDIFCEFESRFDINNFSITDECKKALAQLNQKYDLRFVTASHPYSVMMKSLWLTNNFEWFDPKQLILCQEKWKLRFDIIIDDHLDFLSGCEHGIIFMQPWNVPPDDESEYNSMLRTNNWNDIVKECDWYYKFKENYIEEYIEK